MIKRDDAIEQTPAIDGGFLRRGAVALILASDFWPMDSGVPQLLHRLLELDPFQLADKADHIPARAAPEAMPEVGLGIDGEGGSLLFVEGTEADVVLAFLLEPHSARLDHLDQVRRSLNGVDLFFGDPHDGRLREKPCQEENGKIVMTDGRLICGPVDGTFM